MSAAGGGGHGGGGCGGGESQTHIRCKHLLKTYAGRYVFLVRSCACCRPHTQTWERGADSDGVSIEQVHRTGASHVSFDACLTRLGRPTVALEVWHTHATGPDKIAQTRGAGIALAEFTSADILAMETRLLADRTATYELSNTQVEYVTCGACLEREAREAAQRRRRVEARAAEQLEAEEWRRMQAVQDEADEWRRMKAEHGEADKRKRTLAEQIRRQTARREEMTRLEKDRERRASRPWSVLREDGRSEAASLKASRALAAPRHVIRNVGGPPCSRCVGCRKLHRLVDMNEVRRAKFTKEQLAENGRDWPEHVPMCDSCVVSCVRCADDYPLARAVIYGLCYDCHKCCARKQSPFFERC